MLGIHRLLLLRVGAASCPVGAGLSIGVGGGSAVVDSSLVLSDVSTSASHAMGVHG